MEHNLEWIKKILPHRYPFIFVDRVTSVSDRKITAEKYLSPGEEYFKGHFPSYPIFPAVFQLEGMAQCAGLILMKDIKTDGTVPLFVGVNNARFRREIRPGCNIIYDVDYTEERIGIHFFNGKITVDTKICATADIMIKLKKEEKLNDNRKQ
jgi:3-hydroxyacyl-[acyl-carrier-protein] dehydratase